MSKALVVNGIFYAGENKADNVFVFVPERPKALAMSETELEVVLCAVFEWVMTGEIVLKRIEVLDVADGRDSSTTGNPLGSIS